MESIETWKNALPVPTSIEMRIAAKAEMGDMLRIDLEQIPVFVPRHSARQHHTEDTTIPRICVCDSLMGCVAGYASFYHDFDAGTPDGKWLLGKIHYKGGMYIHRIPYEYLVVPSDRLAGDSTISGERWIVPYDEQHAQYASELVGKIFIGSYSSRRHSVSTVVNVYTMFLEISEGVSIKLTPTITLNSGYWKLTQAVRSVSGRVKTKQEPEALTYVKISSQEYLEAKGMGIGLLSEKINTAKQW